MRAVDRSIEVRPADRLDRIRWLPSTTQGKGRGGHEGEGRKRRERERERGAELFGLLLLRGDRLAAPPRLGVSRGATRLWTDSSPGNDLGASSRALGAKPARVARSARSGSLGRHLGQLGAEEKKRRNGWKDAMSEEGKKRGKGLGMAAASEDIPGSGAGFFLADFVNQPIEGIVDFLLIAKNIV